MFSKIIILALLGTSLAVNVPDVYSQLDAQNLQKYYNAKDPISAQFYRDWTLGRVLYIIEAAKQQALARADKSQVEEVAWEWVEVQQAYLNVEWEIRNTIEAVRQQGLTQAPQEWAQLAQRTVYLLEAAKQAGQAVNSAEIKRIITVHRNDVRQIYNKLRPTQW